MKKYDHNMDSFEFHSLTSKLGLYFPLRKCGSPGFREQIFEKLENGESPHDIQCWYDYKYHGFVHPSKKDKDSTPAKQN